MGMWRWVESGLKIATGWIPGLGTAVEEGLEHLADHRGRRSALAALLDLEEHTWTPDSSPASLLRADFGIVPFYPRNAEQDDLDSWCDGGPPLALRLYTAPGGFGKTRFFRQVVRARREAGWQAGFLREGMLARHGTEALFSRGKTSLLLVLDYAESRRAEIEPVVAAARGCARETVRIVLLARSDGDWWGELQRAGDGVGDFFQGPAVTAPIRLSPLTGSVDERETVYASAARAFARKLRGPEATWAVDRVPPLDDEDFERVLLIHAAALAAVEGEQVPSGGLLDWLLHREVRGIERVRKMHAGLGPELQRALLHAATLVTLAQGADSRQETVEIIRRAPSLADQPRARLDEIAEALHVLYRGRRWCDGVEPDLVGEHLVWRQLTDAPELLPAAFAEEVPEAQLETGLTVLNRLAQREPAARSLLTRAIEGDLGRLAVPAVRVAIATGDPIGLVLAQALSRDRDLEVARQLVDHLPYPTTALREAAAEVEEILRTQLEDGEIAERTEEERQKLATRANNRSLRLADLGRREDALEAIQQAVEIRPRPRARTARRLPARPRQEPQQPLQPPRGPGTARGRAGGHPAGRRDPPRPRARHGPMPSGPTSPAASTTSPSASRTWDGARTHWRPSSRPSRSTATSRAHGPMPSGPTSPASLNNLSIRLADLGRREEALDAIQQAVEIYRELAGARPDAFRPDLARSLNNLSNRLADLGRREDALEAIQQAVEICRDLARARPDAFRPDLAMSLNNLSNRLADLGRREDALEASQQAVEIYRDLARARPDAFRPDLAMSLNNLSNRLADLGRREDALDAIQQAVEIYRDLAGARPDAFRPDLAMSLNNLSNRLADLGRREDALEAIQQAVEIYRDLARARPDAFRPDLAMSLNNLSNRLADLGRREEALEAIQQAVEIYRDLAGARPDAFRPDLARSVSVLHDRMKEAGRLREALEAAREAIDLLEPHFRRVPRAFAELMQAMIRDYEETAEACGVPPDEERLRSIREALTGLEEEG